MLHCLSVVNSVEIDAKYHQYTISSYICTNVFLNYYYIR